MRYSRVHIAGLSDLDPALALHSQAQARNQGYERTVKGLADDIEGASSRASPWKAQTVLHQIDRLPVGPRAHIDNQAHLHGRDAALTYAEH